MQLQPVTVAVVQADGNPFVSHHDHAMWSLLALACLALVLRGVHPLSDSLRSLGGDRVGTPPDSSFLYSTTRAPPPHVH